ncbi:MAG: Lrp/AsnC ligand binding domain-containing protein, partial [Promethearchaeia archaeon]
MAKVESAKTRSVLERVKKFEQVQEAYVIYGAYDLIIQGQFE